MPIADMSEVLLELGLSASATDEERAMASVAVVRAEGAVRRFLHYDPELLQRTEFYPQADRSLRSGGSVWESEGGTAYLRNLAGASASGLQLQHIPVRSVDDLRIDYDGRSGTRAGSFPLTSLKVEGSDYWPNYDGEDGNTPPVGICRDGILKSAGRWPAYTGAVRVVYRAGYSPAELHGQVPLVDASPINEAVVDEAVRRVRRAQVWKKRTGVGFAAGPMTSEKLGDYGYTIDASLASRLFGSAFELTPETRAKLNSFVNAGWPLGG